MKFNCQRVFIIHHQHPECDFVAQTLLRKWNGNSKNNWQRIIFYCGRLCCNNRISGWSIQSKLYDRILNIYFNGVYYEYHIEQPFSYLTVIQPSEISFSSTTPITQPATRHQHQPIPCKTEKPRSISLVSHSMVCWLVLQARFSVFPSCNDTRWLVGWWCWWFCSCFDRSDSVACC